MNENIDLNKLNLILSSIVKKSYNSIDKKDLTIRIERDKVFIDLEEHNISFRVDIDKDINEISNEFIEEYLFNQDLENDIKDA